MAHNLRSQPENEQRVAEEYLSSLADLNCNSKPLINMLTMLAEENIDYAAVIVKVVEQHIAQVPPDFKLPILYLIDSIVKNVKGTYVQLFSQCIVNIFCGVFEMVHEKIRERMYSLRQTWNEVFLPQKLYALDVKVKRLDNNWPITAKPPAKPAIHVNPNFLKNVSGVAQSALPSEMEEILQVKTRELLELKKRKLELELEQTKKHLEEQEQQLSQTTTGAVAVAPSGGMVAANNGGFAPPMSGRMLAPGMVAPADLLQQQQQQMTSIQSQRPGNFNHNFRNVGPRNGSGNNTQQQQHQQQQQQHQQHQQQQQQQSSHNQAHNNNAPNKLKVHPVNAALLNSVRQRDPRLARQQQQQSQQQHLPPPSTTATVRSYHHADGGGTAAGGREDRKSSSSHRHGSSGSKSSRSRSKSPTRSSSTSATNRHGSGGGGSSRSHKSSSGSHSSSSSRADRKRSESKSSTTSTSSSSSTNSERRKIANAAAINSSPTSAAAAAATRDKANAGNKYDYDTFDIESLTTTSSKSINANKRRSSSPPVAAAALKSKRSNKSRSGKSTHSPSRSPNDYKDVDMRTRPNTTSPEKQLNIDMEEHQQQQHQQQNKIKSSNSIAGSSLAASGNATTNDLEKPAADTNKGNAATSERVLITSSSMDIDLRQLAATCTSLPPAFDLPKAAANVAPTAPAAAASAVAVTAAATKSSSSTSDSSSSSSLSINNKNSPITSKATTINTIIATTVSKPTTTTKTTKTTNTITTTTTTTFTTIPKTTTTTIATTTTTLPSKVSFKIQKPFNKLEKSTANSTTTTTTATAAAATTTTSSSSSSTAATNNAAASAGNVSDALKETISKLYKSTLPKDHQQQDSLSGEKRPSANAGEEEPQQKKSRTNKIDALFGSEDVDLRKEILLSSSTSSSQKKVQSGFSTPPPPVISDMDEPHSKHQHAVENWSAEKSKPISPKKQATFEEIRAKLAKSAKVNKYSKSDKLNKEQVQRLKLAELNMNDDSQEANDEKIRTILTQAQEMFENNGMNQEQYKELVQNMMSVNETSKLKEAKRREALKAAAEELTADTPLDRERNAARDAVLRKRIPKLIKSSGGAGGGNNQANENHMHDSPRSEGSPIYEERNADAAAATTTAGGDANETTTTTTMTSTKTGKEKRRKPSKWGEQVIDPQRAAWLAANSGTGNNNNNNNNNNNKRGGGGFRGGNQNNNARMAAAQMPWQRGNGGGGPFVPNVGGGMSIMSTVPPPPQPPTVTQPMLLAAIATNIPKPCNSIDNPQAEIMRSITIDGTSKEIRIYNQVAIVFMQGDEPHEIGFQPGQRALIIDNMDPFTLQFNDVYKPITIDGVLHHIRFGFPSRELYIDDQWYEIYFGGPPVSIPIRNSLHILKAEGPPPQVHIGAVRRDLVVGKITMIVDAHTIIPLFLDAKVQTFQLADQQHTIQFVDGFLNVLFDGELHKIEYGGLPKSIGLSGRKYFIRFGTLPPGVVAGKVQIQDMLYIKTDVPTMTETHSAADAATDVGINDSLKTDRLGVVPAGIEAGAAAPVAPIAMPATAAAAFGQLNIDELFKKLVSSGIIGTASGAPVMQADASATAAAPSAAMTNNNNNKNKTTAAINSNSNSNEKNNKQANSSSMTPAASITPETDPIIPINLSKSESIKTRQPAIIATLYLGMQCGSCGVRFPPEQTIKYSQHLDWHFRQNRRERDASRKAHARKWFYDLNNWIQYEEIEDLEEREKNLLEAQQHGGGPELIDDASSSNHLLSQQRSQGSPQPSCAAGPDDVNRCCDMCHEKFEQFYNEELEEWHLRGALRVEEKIYHPLCYDDYKASLNPPPPVIETSKLNADPDLNASDDNAVDIIIKIESEDKEEEEDATTGPAIIDDDDDDVIVLPNEEPSVTEIMDDDEDEYVPANVTHEEMGNMARSETDRPVAQTLTKQKSTMNETTESDVEIEEPNIPFTDLDNYVEKDLPALDEATQAALLNVKIKEEPKDDEYDDEDDGFEDVGVVLITPGEEISIQSSEDTQTHTIASSASPPPTERPPSVTSLTTCDAIELEQVSEQSTINLLNDLNASMDGNMEATQETHNLSAAGPTPALPLASLVNKIKINITKNTSSSSSNHNSASSNATTASAITTTTTTADTETSHGGDNSISSSLATGDSQSSMPNTEVSNIQTISTIPVLCGGSTIVPKITLSSSNAGASSTPANISTISVIGSSYGSTRYAMSKPTITPSVAPAPTPLSTLTSAATSLTPATRQSTATPPPSAAAVTEPEPTIVLKPALRNVALKKTKKIENGIETSGLCSIM